ncbi:MAG: fibronectin type III domain-containing protein, partial [Ilumatobacteraceae bacterium]
MTRIAAGVAAVAVASLALLSTDASALPPGTPAAGTSVLAPATGTNANTFTLAPPAGASCPGDSASGGYRWQTFMTATSVDPATITYGLSGPVQQAGEFSKPLFNSTGAPQINKTTAVTTGLITPLPLFGWDASILPVPNGAYNIGYACTTTGTTQKFWSTPITITNSTATSFSYAFGATPAAPVLGGTLAAGDQTLDGTFTHAVSVPATTGYTVTAVPTAGATVTLSLAAGSTSFSLTGLVNGTQYAVSVVATNTVGASPVSNTVNGTPNPGARPAVTSLAAVPGTGNVVLNWVTPTGVAPTGYTIAVSPSVAGAPFTAAAGATTFTVNGTPGTLYTFTVTPTHPSPYVGTAASISATPNA